MSSCEKCWQDAGGDPDEYQALIKERTGDLMCTAEQQAGPGATKCDRCGTMTVHRHAQRCTICGAAKEPGRE